MGKRELVALLCLSSWCLVIDVWLFLAVPQLCLQFVIVVFPDHTPLLYFKLQTVWTLNRLINELNDVCDLTTTNTRAKTSRYNQEASSEMVLLLSWLLLVI